MSEPEMLCQNGKWTNCTMYKMLHMKLDVEMMWKNGRDDMICQYQPKCCTVFDIYERKIADDGVRTTPLKHLTLSKMELCTTKGLVAGEEYSDA